MIPPGAFLQVTEEAKPGFEKAFLRADSRDRGQHGTRAEMWGYHYDYRSAAANSCKVHLTSEALFSPCIFGSAGIG